jgi:hypothetical protein
METSDKFPMNCTDYVNQTVESASSFRSLVVFQLLFQCLMCALSSILAYAHFYYHNRALNLAEKTVVTYCSMYLIQSVNAQIWIHWTPIFIKLISGPTTILVAHLIEILFSTNGCALCGLGAAISISKIVIVTHFDRIYNLNPKLLGNCLGILVYLIAFGITVTVNLADLISGQIHSNFVASLSSQPSPPPQITPGGINVIFWLLLYIFSAIIAKIYIYIGLKKRLKSMAVRVGEASPVFNENGLPVKKLLFSCLILAVLVFYTLLLEFGFLNSETKVVPHSELASSLVLNLILFYLVSSSKLLEYFQRKVSTYYPLNTIKSTRVRPAATSIN